MRALAALLLAPSISFASWTFESYLDANGMEGFRTFNDGVLQYEIAPDYDGSTASSFRPVDINGNGYLIGDATIVDFPDSNGNAWDLMMFILDPTGQRDKGLWIGASGWIGGTWACANMGWGYRPALINIGSGEIVPQSQQCYQLSEPAEELGAASVVAAAVPEPGSLALVALAAAGLVTVRRPYFSRSGTFERSA